MKQHRGWFVPESEQHFLGFLDPYPDNHYQQQALDLALSYCPGRSMAVDIGANIGLHAVRFSRYFERVICFEPTTAVYDCLRANCASVPNVDIFKVGLGDHYHQTKIAAPENSNNCGVYSIRDFENSQAPTLQEPIAVMPLDAFDVCPDMIKIDVQGYEPWVLRGAQQTLLRCSPVLLIEVEGTGVRNEIRQTLLSIGYEMVSAVRHDQVWVKKAEPTDACVASNDPTSDHPGSNETGPTDAPNDHDLVD